MMSCSNDLDEEDCSSSDLLKANVDHSSKIDLILTAFHHTTYAVQLSFPANLDTFCAQN